MRFLHLYLQGTLVSVLVMAQFCLDKCWPCREQAGVSSPAQFPGKAYEELLLLDHMTEFTSEVIWGWTLFVWKVFKLSAQGLERLLSS